MSDSQLISIFTASSFQEAHIVAGFLESEGIATHVPGADLVDEFGMATKMAGFAEVKVASKDLEAAKEIVAAWKERGKAHSDED